MRSVLSLMGLMFMLGLATVALPEVLGHFTHAATPIARTEQSAKTGTSLSEKRLHLREEVLFTSFKMEENRNAAFGTSFGISFFLLLAGLGLYAAQKFTASRLLGMAALHFSMLWLVTLSAGALAVQLLIGMDCLHLLPWFMWAGPVAGVLVSEIYLYIFDMNHFFWNAAVKALILTQALCLLAFAANRL